MDEGFVSRRAAVAALSIGPALALAGTATVRAAVGPDGSAWTRARADYLTADMAVASFDRNCLSPASERYTAAVEAHSKLTLVGSSKHADIVAAERALDPIQSRFDDLVDVEHSAFVAMIETPAPDLAAVAEKIRLGFEGEMWFGGMPVDQIASIYADIRRLQRPAA